ncbi:membrane-associated protein, putative [Bodo saltans]|uniref:Membrane-associated protein, putative n=1 Tax=Bodo saltans TaxID=75058 RepID=A0A0S4JA90_BODSA|nr:membrane-associated protein, putative [Bodo saltans]|eukprot:CUG85788.1 membrane-associated protein, putative [Bodo saltans]
MKLMLQIGFTPAHLHIIFIISVIALVPFPATTAAAACVKINDTLSFIANTTIVVSSNSTTYLLDSCTEPIRFEADCSTTTASVTVSNITIIVEGSKTSALPTVAVSCSPVDHAPNWDALRIALRNLNTNLTSNGTAILDTASTKSVLTNSMLTIEDSWISVGWNGTGLAPWFLNVANTPSNTNDFSGTNLTFAIRNCTLHLRNMKFMFFKTLSTVVMRSISVVMEGVHMRIWMDRIVEFGNRIGMFSFDNNFAVSEFDLRFTNIQVSTVVNIGAMNFSVILTQEISWSLLYFHIWGENSSELNFIVTNSTFNISQEFSNSATLQSVLPSVEIDDVVCLLVAVMYVDTPPTRVAVKLSALHVNVTNTFLLGNASSSVQLMYVSGDGTSEVNTTVLDDIRIVVRNVSMIAERSGVLPLNTTITRCNVLAFEKSSLYGALIVVQDVEAHCYMEIGDKKRQHYPGVTTFGFVGWITRSQLLYMHNCLLQDFNASIVSSQLTVENIQGGFITLGFTHGAGILTFFDIAAFSFVVAVRCSILLEGSKLTAAVEIPVDFPISVAPYRDLLFPSNIAQVAAMTFAGTVTNSSVELRESTSVVRSSLRALN